MAGESNELLIAQTLGRLEGKVTQGFEDMKRRLDNLDSVPQAVVDHERRLKDLEAKDEQRIGDRRFFWTGLVAIIAAAATAVRALWPHVGGG